MPAAAAAASRNHFKTFSKPFKTFEKELAAAVTISWAMLTSWMSTTVDHH